RIFAEYTLAGTSQLMDMRSGQWSEAILKKFGLPLDIMPEIIPPGTIVGPLQSAICRELATEPIKVVAAGSHDTACAVAAVPAETENWAYISSGTWSLIGVEIDRPIINDEVLNHGFTNEGGAANTIRFLKNSMGLWPLQQCKRQWQSEGADLSYNELTALAQNAEPFAVHLDLNFEPLFTPGDMPAKINEYLKKTGQSPLRDKGQMVRTILESLALQYRSVIEAIERIRKIPVEVIHIVGGGSQNDLLSQFAADAVGKKVIAGPVEATAMGNITLQAIADGQIKSLPQGREIIRHSVELKTYHPQEREKWSVPYFKYMV
ncbi:MAG: carbohydrate kinase, partial [Phycisphaerae bacterium SM23_30]